MPDLFKTIKKRNLQIGFRELEFIHPVHSIS